MKFDFARPPFIPAFLTLLILALLWANRCMTPAAPALPAGTDTEVTADTTDKVHPAEPIPAATRPDPAAEASSGTIPPADRATIPAAANPAAATPATDTVTASAPLAAALPADSAALSPTDSLATAPDTSCPAVCEPPRMMFALPAALLDGFTARHPFWGKTLAVLLILFMGVTVGRIALRYNLYTVNSALPVPLSFMLLLMVGSRGLDTAALGGMTCFAFALKNFCRSFRSGYTFDANFRAGLYLGLMLLIHPTALPLLVLFPAALFLFNRTLREALVASCGLVFTPLLLCYANWAAHGDFTAPLWLLWHDFMTGEPGEFLMRFILPDSPLQIAVAVLVLAAILMLRGNLYAVGTKPRYILLYSTCATIVALLLCLSPSADAPTAAYVALPASLLITGFLIRMPRTASTILCTALLAAAVVRIFLQ